MTTTRAAPTALDLSCHACRKLRRDIDHELVEPDKPLRDRAAHTVRSFDGPHPIRVVGDGVEHLDDDFTLVA